MKVREVIKMIEDDGWEMVARKGTNHRQFKHKIKPGRVTISGNPGDEFGPGTLNSILKQARLKGKKP
ncbi:MAG: type II toxin-antitoxin system HicA family toxin [Candidatus Riflebacteria bacterium]|nr:type II toxin-antitoxin system HicA family toxin [Candidatus Riflebacteria bacterium]